MRTQHSSWIAIAGVTLLLLAGCAAEPTGAGPDSNGGAAKESSETDKTEPSPTDTEPPAEPEHQGPRDQSEDCGWDAPALSASMPGVPSGQNGELTNVIVGAWQHTHIDSGAGYEAVEKDIRYVFPSTERILYCQHVPGVTDYAENAAPITWDSTRIVLPGSAPGYVVSEWNDDVMVWINRLDDSRYLLQRR